MANGVYNRGYYIWSQVNSTSVAWTGMLVSTSYVWASSHDFVNSNTSSGVGGEPKVFEITVAGYSRQALASLTLTEDDTNKFSYLDATDLTFSALTAGQTVGGCVLYRYSSSGGTTGDSGQDLLCFYDLTDTPTNGGDIVVQFASSSQGGVLKVTSTS